MARTRFDDWPCSVARTVDLVGDAWTLLVLRECFYGVRRFEPFQERLEIGRNVLAGRLKRLVDGGVLDKVPYQDRPLRHEYLLTEKGRALFAVIVTLMRWGDDWMSGPEGVPVELRDRDGHPVRPVVVDEATGRPLDPRRVVAAPGPGFPEAHRDRAEREGRFGGRRREVVRGATAAGPRGPS
ncbi:MAG: winged helix-turn-helix transcriptional regulator [Sandaracinaceae bacterium]